MTTRNYSSRSQQTTLSSALNNTATTMVVGSASVLLGGASVPAGTTFTVVINPDTAIEEIVDVTAVNTNTLTIAREIDGSVKQTHSAGSIVRHMAIGRDYREANLHVENTTTAHGLTLANVTLSSGTGNVSTQMLASNAVTTAKITDANVTTAKIADSAITSAKIADLGIATGDIADLAITTGKIAAEAVTTAKIPESAITNSRIAADAVTSDKIANDAVGTTEIANLAVTTGKIADSAITSAKIADGTIVAGDIADGAVTSAKILDGTIVEADLADGAVTSAKILNGTIVNADINSAAEIDKTKISGTAVTVADSGTVTSAMIADGAIVNGDINSAAAIAYSKLNLNSSITSADIVDGTIVAGDIANGTITAAKLVADPYARANHTGTQLAATVSDFDTQVRTSRLDQMAAPTGSVALNSQKITGLGTPTVSTDASTKAYVDAQITALVGGAPGTLDTLAEIASAISSGGSFESTVVLKSGSTMTGALTLSGAPSSNLHAATKAYVDTVAGSATAAAASAAAAATTYDNFDDRYVGAKSTAPSVDNDGNALITGALYWNSTSNTMFAWNGTAWASISSAAEIYRYKFTPTAGVTSVSGTDANGASLSYIPNKEQVYLNGVLLVRGADYTATDGSTITSLAAITAGDVLEVITFTSFEVANAVTATDFTISQNNQDIMAIMGAY
jgi:hypothetical protein